MLMCNNHFVFTTNSMAIKYSLLGIQTPELWDVFGFGSLHQAISICSFLVDDKLQGDFRKRLIYSELSGSFVKIKNTDFKLRFFY